MEKIEIYAFAKGKQVPAPSEKDLNQWLIQTTVEMKKLTDLEDSNFTEFDINHLESSPSYFTRTAIEILKTSVSPKDVCLLTFCDEDEKRGEPKFSIIRYINNYISTDSYYINPIRSLGKSTMQINSHVKNIIIASTPDSNSIICKIEWTNYNYPNNQCLYIDIGTTSKYLIEQVNFQAYLDSIMPDNIDFSDIFEKLKKFDLHYTSISIKKPSDCLGNAHYFYRNYNCYTLKYQFGKTLYEDEHGSIIFSSLSKSSDKFPSITSLDSDIKTSTKQYDRWVQMATKKAKTFFTEICKK